MTTSLTPQSNVSTGLKPGGSPSRCLSEKVIDLEAERSHRELLATLGNLTKRILRAKGYPVAMLMLLALGGCGVTPQQLDARLNALEARLEPEVDAMIDAVVARLCKLPIDIMSRQLDTPDKARGALLFCEPLQDLYGKLKEADPDGK